MEACNGRYFFVQRLFGIGLRSSQPSITSEILQASPSKDGIVSHAASGRGDVRAMSLRTFSLKEGRLRI